MFQFTNTPNTPTGRQRRKRPPPPPPWPRLSRPLLNRKPLQRTTSLYAQSRLFLPAMIRDHSAGARLDIKCHCAPPRQVTGRGEPSAARGAGGAPWRSCRTTLSRTPLRSALSLGNQSHRPPLCPCRRSFPVDRTPAAGSSRLFRSNPLPGHKEGQ